MNLSFLPHAPSWRAGGRASARLALWAFGDVGVLLIASLCCRLIHRTLTFLYDIALGIAGYLFTKLPVLINATRWKRQSERK